MKYQDIIEKMTLEEKAAFLSGKNEWQTWDFPRLAIPSIFFSDGPCGVRKQVGEGDHLGIHPSIPATCFPSAAAIANSWDEKLAEEIGKALGEEAKAQKVNVLLGPGLNMKRSPLCGRNFEYFSEDPYLAGKLAAAYIRGIQSRGVSACPKHFAVNNQELRRMAMNAVVDERTLREIYLTGFEIAVKEGGAKAIMTSYNEVNGIYANENQHLIKDILRREWGFNGIIVTDWGGSNDHVKGVKAGSNLEMPAPGFDSARELIKAVEENRLSEDEIDSCVSGLLDAVFTLSQKKEKIVYNKAEHHRLARKASAESVVLLKNVQNILPIQSGKKVAVIGEFAKIPRYQGAGSSAVNPTYLESVSRLVKKCGLKITGIASGYERTGANGSRFRQEKLLREALVLAAKSEIVLYFFGLDESSEAEGMDRKHMKLPQNQIELLQSIWKVNKNIVGILSGGSVIEMPWQSKLKAILHGYLGGQAGAGAILDIVTGKVNPSGKLAETYPVRYEDTPAFHYFPGKERSAEYREGIYIGYRYYDTAGVKVRYPFGYGLSYTTFQYSDLIISENQVTFTVTNTGKCGGTEIAQMYVRLPDSEVFRPEKELKGFVKIQLKAAESKKAEILFDDKTFRFWNVKTEKWEIESGRYQILIGAHAGNICLKGEVEITGTMRILPYERENYESYYCGEIRQVSDREFERLLGRPAPDGKWSRELGLNDAVCQMYYAKSLFARVIWKYILYKKKKCEKKGKPDLNILFICNIPFRAMAKMTEGLVSMEMAEGIVAMVNGHFFRGMKKVIVGFFVNLRENKKYLSRLSASSSSSQKLE